MTDHLSVGGKERLADEALKLKKAWLLAAVWIGTDAFGGKLGPRELLIPAYKTWKRKDLQEHVPKLLEDFVSTMSCFTTVKTRRQQERAAAWMAKHFERWQAAGGGLYAVCTVQQFERDVGPLKVRAAMDLPPYTELLMQGLQSLAFRHPEYHQSRDLQFLFNLAHDAEAMIASVNWNRPPKWAYHGSENAQSLNRATIQTCFNLLESFTSGLARAFELKHPNLDDQTTKRLLDDTKPLRNRIIAVPEIIAGRSCGLDVNKPPISELFGPIKQRRDAFVHCVPGQVPHRGYVKESAFHDVPFDVVQSAVTLTLEIINCVWRFLHKTERPSWLPTIGSDGRFGRENLRLSPPPPVHAKRSDR